MFYYSNERCVKEDKGLKMKVLSAKEGKAKGQCYTSSCFSISLYCSTGSQIRLYKGVTRLVRALISRVGKRCHLDTA